MTRHRKFRACPLKSVSVSTASRCPLRSESDRSAALPRIDAMCQKRAFAGYATASEISPAASSASNASASALRLWAAQVTHIECFHRSAKAFKGEFAGKFYVRQCLDGAEHINIDQNLSILSLIAKSGGKICHFARNRLLEPPLVSDASKRCIAVRNADAKADVVPRMTPFD